jgi:hypothetical protein
MAALAHRTSRAALVVLGSSIAPYDPPIRIAEEFAMLDVMSGAGWSQATRLAPQWTRIMPMAGCRAPCVSVMPRHTSSPDVHPMTMIPKNALSDHASNGNPTYCSANDAWACSEACR